MAGQLEYSSTAASNTTINGIGIAGSNSVKNGDDALRQLMADTAAAVTKVVDKAAGTYTAAKTDYNQLWRATGAVTINLTAAATLTSGWCLWVKADGGAVTVDPAGAEQINGAATLSLPDGFSTLIICTGSAFLAIILGQGDVTLAGVQTLINKTLTQPVITLKQSISPLPTAEGDIQWDTDGNAIVVGDGVGQKTFSDDGVLKGFMLGIGQTWQDVAAGRAIDTSYQNTTGKPIAVFVRVNEGASANVVLQVSTDNVAWTVVSGDTTATQVSRLYGIVPPNHYYRVSHTTGAGSSIVNWAELR